MVELREDTPCAGLLPLEIGGWQLEEVDLGHLTSLAPYKDKQAALSQALNAAHGLAYPAPNTSCMGPDGRAIWFGRDLALLAGPAPDASLISTAALTDQTDAWCAVKLAGEGTEDVLARLVPVDLRLSSFAVDSTCRTLLGHMHASITRLPDSAFLILVFRSMAHSLIHDVQEAMEAVAARR